MLFYQGDGYLSKYYSQIIVVHVHANIFFLNVTQRVAILLSVSNQEVAIKNTDKHTADCSKAVCWGVKSSM